MTLKFMAITAIVIIISSCGSEDSVEKKDYSVILHSPPVAGISDSINRFPEDPVLRQRRATLLSHLNEHLAATDDYRKIWELTGTENGALDYASNLMLAQRLNEAIAFLEECMKKFPGNTEFNRRLAEINFHKGNYKEALEEYTRILSIDSSNFEAWYDKGTLQGLMKDTAGSIESLERSFSLMPINYSGMALANMYVAKKDPRALEICDILLTRDSVHTQTEPVFMKGVYYADIKEYDKALRQFEECIRRDWKMTDAYIEKGIILFERKQYDEALKVFNMTTTVSNTDPDAYFWLGRCYEATGKTEEAITNYQRALSLDDTFTEARTALRRLNG
jgi:tetratricopeptide (TPR) repeat protein